MPGISPQEVAVYRVLHDAYHRPHKPLEWLTTSDLASRASVAPRTARRLAWKLAELGVARMISTHPAYKYRLKTEDEIRPEARKYRERLREAADALGQPLDTERTAT